MGLGRVNNDALHQFMDAEVDSPVVMEIFTDKTNDVKVLKGFRRLIHQESLGEKVVEQIKKNPVVQQVVQTDAGQNIKNKLKSGLRRFF